MTAIHPNQVAAMRPRFSNAGGKSDNFDAFVLAELARTDSHRFRILVPDCDATKALRALTRAREDLVAHRVALANELRAQLECLARRRRRVRRHRQPNRARIHQALPRARGRAGLGEQRLQRFLTRHGYCGRRTPAELLARLRGAADGRADTLESEARRQIVLSLVAALEPLVARIARAHQRDPRRAARPHRRREVPLAVPRPEVRDHRRHDARRDRRLPRPLPNRRALAADAGQAPVAVESGKSKRARFRWACDHRLRNAICTLADSSRHHNPWAADIYQRARARGATHPHAIRILGRAWCHVIWRLWQDQTAYDPTQHTALQHLLTRQAATN